MDCKRALDEAQDNLGQAEALLLEWGLKGVARKAGREASQGLVESYIHAGGRVGALVEVNCETDFVARTDDFKRLAHEIAMQVCAMNPTSISADEASPNGNHGDDDTDESVPLLQQAFIRDPSKTIQDLVNENIARLHENIVVRRFARFELGAG
ncbi:MAG: elongation factor Ts [Chloroflexi bacterium]|nr:elongation factor Ts [Chloroflexota bacterium]